MGEVSRAPSTDGVCVPSEGCTSDEGQVTVTGIDSPWALLVPDRRPARRGLVCAGDELFMAVVSGYAWKRVLGVAVFAWPIGGRPVNGALTGSVGVLDGPSAGSAEHRVSSPVAGLSIFCCRAFQAEVRNCLTEVCSVAVGPPSQVAPSSIASLSGAVAASQLRF